MKLFFGLAAVLSLTACPSSSPPPNTPPSPYPPASAEAACANVDALGCAEGAPEARCPAAMARAAQLRDVDFGCLAAAGSKAAVRACSDGFVRCP